MRAPWCAGLCPSQIESPPAGTQPTWRGSSNEADVSLRPGEWAIVHGLIAVLAALLTTLLTNFNLLLAVIAFGLGLLLPWLYLGYRASNRRKAFYAALPDSMQMMAGSLKAGYSLPQALDNVANESGGAFGQEINRALLESRLGLPLEEALEAVAQRMESKDFHWVVMAIRINRRVGGNLAEVLTTVGRDPAGARAPASSGQDAERRRGPVRLDPWAAALPDRAVHHVAEPWLLGAPCHHRDGMDHDRHRRSSSTSSGSSGCATP